MYKVDKNAKIIGTMPIMFPGHCTISKPRMVWEHRNAVASVIVGLVGNREGNRMYVVVDLWDIARLVMVVVVQTVKVVLRLLGKSSAVKSGAVRRNLVRGGGIDYEKLFGWTETRRKGPVRCYWVVVGIRQVNIVV